MERSTELDRKEFERAKVEIDKIRQNEKGNDLGPIARCAASLQRLIGNRPADLQAQDPLLVDALRKAVCEELGRSPRDGELYEHLRQFVLTLGTIRSVKKKPRDNASFLCGRLAQWLLSAEESRACKEGVTMPADAPFAEART